MNKTFGGRGARAAIAVGVLCAIPGAIQAQSQFPPLQNQQGGFSGQQAPYPGQPGGAQGGYGGQQAPYQAQPGTMPQGGFPPQQQYAPQGGPSGGVAGQPQYPSPSGMPQGGMGGMPQGGDMAGMPQGGGMGGMPQGSMGGMQQGGTTPGGMGGGASPLAARLDSMMAEERRDFGVRPTPQLHGGAMHGPTPNQIPGGQVITTKGLHALMQRRDVPYVVFDVLGSQERLPGAIPAVPAAAGGNFRDQTQQQLGQFLAQVTRQNKQVPVVFYCQGIQCWMSYNAALRAINLGYRNVLWYRGGIEAWKYAGLPTQPAHMQAQMPPQGGPPQPYRR